MTSFLMALIVNLFMTQPAVVDDTEAIADDEFYRGSIEYEHPTCRVKFVTAGPLITMYLEGKPVALFDISKPNYLERPLFIDRLLQEEGLPQMYDLDSVQCI